MDIYNFLNSRDVRKYLQDINYEFTPEQALYVILHNRTKSVKEKHQALTELAESYPDFMLEKRRSHIKPQPLKQYAERYIAIQNRVIEEFFKKESDCYYSARFLAYEDFCKWEQPFSDFESAFNAHSDYSEETILIEIEKTHIETGKTICLTLLPDKTVTEIYYVTSLSDEDDAILRYPEWMWVNIPVPFKHGDVVFNVERKNDQYLTAQDLMVVDTLNSWTVEDYKANGFINSKKYSFNSANFDGIDNRIANYKEYGDESDMCVVGKIVFESGIISYDHVWTYLDFEYYRGDYNGDKAIIKLLSNYYKCEIDEELLLNAYFIIRSELAADRKSTLRLYTNEGAVLAGLKDRCEIKITDDERVEIIAKRILKEHKKAFKELAK